MTDKKNTPITDDDRAAILEGLASVRRNGLKGMLTALSGPPGKRRKHIRMQAAVTPMEKAALTLAMHTLALQVGRPVSYSLVLRLALTELCAACHRSLKDPAEAARLRARLVATREERASEYESMRSPADA